MKAAATFEAEIRDNHGKGAARALRREGKVPGIIYGLGKPNVTLSLMSNPITTQYLRGGFFSKVIELKTAKESFFAIPKDVQFHPVSDKIEHIDFTRVDDKSTIKAHVAVRFINQEKSVGLKRGGVLNVVRHDVELYCKINNIPASIEIDLLNVNIGESIHISHITLPEGVTPVIKDRDFTIATVAGRSGKSDAADDAAAPAASAAAVPTAGDEKKAATEAKK